MHKTRGFTFLLLFSAVLSFTSSVMIYITAELNDPATLPCNKTCNGGHVEWRMVSGLIVASCRQGRCTTEVAFENRSSLTGDGLSLTTNPVVYNDQGGYECRCGVNVICDVNLEVLVPRKVNASVGDTVSLRCYAHTNKQTTAHDGHIRWERDHLKVLEFNNGVLTYGPGFENRSSVSADGYRNGDLSLIINPVRPSDKGLYCCYYKQDRVKGYAISLHVAAHQDTSKVETDVLNHTTPTLAIGLGVGGSVLVLVLATTGYAIHSYLEKKKKTGSGSRSGAQSSVELQKLAHPSTPGDGQPAATT